MEIYENIFCKFPNFFLVPITCILFFIIGKNNSGFCYLLSFEKNYVERSKSFLHWNKELSQFQKLI